MPAPSHTALSRDAMMPQTGDLVELDVPPLVVGLHRVAEPGETFRVVGRREAKEEATASGEELVVRKPSNMSATYRLGPGHVRRPDSHRR